MKRLDAIRNGIAVLLCCAPARADIEVREPHCIDAVALEQQIRGWLKMDALASDFHVVVDGDARDEVSFSVERGSSLVGRRAFRTKGMTCPNVTALVSLAIAMAIDAAPIVTREAPPPPPPPIVPPKPRPPPPPKPSHAIPWTIGLELATLAGILQKPALGGALTVGAGLTKHLWARAAVWQSANATSELGSGTFTTSLIAGELALCVAVPVDRVLLRACGGAVIGRLAATGHGYEISSTALFSWVAPVFRIDAIAHVAGALSIAVFVEEMTPLPHAPEIDVMRRDVVAESATLPPAGVAIGLGPVLRFE